MSRGGRRSGAGAPKGNLNALRTGEFSDQAHQWIKLMSATPKGRRLLAALMTIQPADTIHKEGKTP